MVDSSPAKYSIILWIQLYLILCNVDEQFISAQDLCDLDQLIVVVMTMKKWFFAKDLQPVTSELYGERAKQQTIEANMHPRLHISTAV